jgi:hypothetical protein
LTIDPPSSKRQANATRVLPVARERSRGVAVKPTKEWNGAIVRTWLESRVIAARADQVVAERGGRELQDDCDKASAEEMVCSIVKAKTAVDLQASFSDALRLLLERDEYIWRGVYNDTRFDRHVRSYVRKLLKMAKTNEGFENTTHYQ